MEPPKVKVNIEFLVNMGNFNNFRIEFGVEDFKKDNESTSQAVDRVYELVEAKVLDKADALKKEVRARVTKQ